MGDDAARFAATQARLEREAAEREGDADRRRQERDAGPATTPDQAVDELRAAVERLSKDKRKRAKAHGEKMRDDAAKAEPTPPAASEKAKREADELNAVIAAKRAAMAGDTKKRHRREWHQEREDQEIIIKAIEAKRLELAATG